MPQTPLPSDIDVDEPTGSTPPESDPDQYIRTDALRGNLRNASLRSGLISFAAQPIQVLLGIGSAMILARLLTPSDFGLVAMVIPLLVLVQALQNAGIETATVHREGVDHRQVSALFWLALGVNFILAIFTCLMAPVLVWFYGESELVGITIALAISLFVLGASSQHLSLLKRQMQFGTLMFIEVVALTLSVGAAIGAALLGAGYWALVAQTVTHEASKSAAYWWYCGWRPASFRHVRRTIDTTVREMLSFGAHLTGYRLVYRVGKRLDGIIVGYVGGPTALGLYSNASRWAKFPFEQLYNPLYDVAISGLSRVQDEPETYRAYARIALLPIFAVPVPALAYIIVKAHDVVLVLLGDQWLDAVPLLRLLCVAVFADSLMRVTKWLYVSVGDTERQFRWGLVYTPATITAVFIGAQYGAYGVALAVTIAACTLAGPAVWYCLRSSPLRMRDFLGIVWRPVAASAGAAGVLYALLPRLPQDVSSLVSVLMTLGIFLGVYLVAWVAFPGGVTATREVITIIKDVVGQGSASLEKIAQESGVGKKGE